MSEKIPKDCEKVKRPLRGLKVSQCHFSNLLLDKASNKSSLHTRSGEIDSTIWSEKGQESWIWEGLKNLDHVFYRTRQQILLKDMISKILAFDKIGVNPILFNTLFKKALMKDHHEKLACNFDGVERIEWYFCYSTISGRISIPIYL